MSVFASEIIACVATPKEEIQIELIGEFSKVAGYKINIEKNQHTKSIAFLSSATISLKA